MNAVLSKIAKGMTVYYSEFFPNHVDDYFHFAYMGKLFLIADSYCMRPDCTCQEAALHFVQVYPREQEKPDSFLIGLKLNGRGVRIHDQGKFHKREIQAMVMRYTADGQMLTLLNERYKEMREKTTEILS